MDYYSGNTAGTYYQCFSHFSYLSVLPEGRRHIVVTNRLYTIVCKKTSKYFNFNL